jgi:hypothetical protein
MNCGRFSLRFSDPFIIRLNNLTKIYYLLCNIWLNIHILGYPMQGGRPAYPTQPAPSGYPTLYAGGYPTQAYQQPVYNPQYPQYPQQPQQYPNQQVPYVQPGYGQPPPPYPGAPTPHVLQVTHMVFFF